MDVISGLAAVVGLLGQYAGERRAEAQRSAEDFQSWLAEHRHDEIVQFLKQSDKTVVAIRALLSEDREQLNRQFAEINHSLAVLASANDAFRPLAAALVPGAALSDDAINFLRKFVKSGAGRLLEKQPGLGPDARLSLVELDLPASKRGSVEYGDPRFYQDDVANLAAVGLIRFGRHSGGDRILDLTRAAVTFIEQLDRKP